MAGKEMNAQELSAYISTSGYLAIIVRPNSPATKIRGWDASAKALRVDVHAKPDNNEANEEIVKFFSKLLKKTVSLKRGMRSREKLLLIE